MDDRARLGGAFRVDLPQLLDSDSVGLRLDALTQAEAIHQLPPEVPAAPLGKENLYLA